MNFQALQIHFRIHADLLTQKNYDTRHLLSCSHIAINGHCHCSLHSSNTGMVWFQLRGRTWAVGPYLASTFKHTKGDWKSWSGFIRIRIMCCVVCACQVSKMGKMFASFPTASTSFRSPCIDMRLHSHSDCPLCRVPVTGWIIRQQTRTILLDIRILSRTSTPLHAIFLIQCSEEISICKAHQNLWKIKVIVVQNWKCNMVLENHKDNSLFNLSSFFSQYYTWFLIINML